MFIEGLRTDSLMIGSLRVSQILAGLLFAASLITWFIIRNKIKNNHDDEYLKIYALTDEGKEVIAGTYYARLKEEKLAAKAAAEAEAAEAAEAEEECECEECTCEECACECEEAAEECTCEECACECEEAAEECTGEEPEEAEETEAVEEAEKEAEEK